MSKKSFIDTVAVKSPCSEDWNEMQGTDKIRFCSHCAKDVNNLSEMTRKQATRLVRASNGKLCIRYIQHPTTKRPMFAEQLLQITRRRPGIAAGVMSASIVLSSQAYAQGDTRSAIDIAKVPVIERPMDPPEKLSGSGRISGNILDQHRAAIPAAKVRIISADVSKTVSTVTDGNGEYKFDDLIAGTYLIEAEAPGFAKTLRKIVLAETKETVIDLSLEIEQIELTVDIASDVDIAYTTSGGIGFTEYGSPLAKAVANEEIDEVRELLINGANVDDKDENYDKITPLFLAIETGHIEIVELLLDFGAKVNARDASKQTPIMRLDDDATPDLVGLLIRHGAKVNLKDDNGDTVLILASGAVKPDVLKALIDAGADVRAANKQGQTALMEAAENDDLESVKVLIDAGSEVNAKNKEGDTAWDLASNQEVEALLFSFGAQIKMQKARSEVAEPTSQPAN